MEQDWIQKGRNKNFPLKIKIWKRGDVIPEWLSDRACISSIDLINGYNLRYRNLTSGGYEILDSSGVSTLVFVKKKDHYVCLGDGKIFSLSPEQLNLLYKKDEK
jgi:hypothetical protein